MCAKVKFGTHLIKNQELNCRMLGCCHQSLR